MEFVIRRTKKLGRHHGDKTLEDDHLNDHKFDLLIRTVHQLSVNDEEGVIMYCYWMIYEPFDRGIFIFF